MSQAQTKSGAWLAVAALLVSIFCFQIGASVAKQLFPLVGAQGTVALRVGPEGGWIDSERRKFAESGWQAASLGPCILRAETAVCAALAVVSQMAITPLRDPEFPHKRYY